MAEIKIISHSYRKVETTSLEFGGGSFQPTDTSHTVVETVRAHFAITGGEPFAKTQRSANQVQPREFRITFRSENGGAWQGDAYAAGGNSRTEIWGPNIKKDGSLGADQCVHSYDFPKWAKALYERDEDGRSDALDWVRAEYVRD